MAENHALPQIPQQPPLVPPSAPHAVSDPYSLHPSDHPGLMLVSQPLQEDNYASCRRSMRLALSGKRKLGFIDGSLPKPDPAVDPVLAETWQCTNDIVSTWLLNSVSKEIAASVVYADSAAAIWKDIQDRFSQSNGPRIFELQKSLVGLSQGSLSVSQYFTKLKIIWEELNTYKPLVNCSCGGAKPLQDYLQREYVMVFLMGLNDIYANVRGQILLNDPLPPIAKVFSLILQEEKQRAVGSANSVSMPNQVAFAVKTNPVKPSYDNSKTKPAKKDRPLCAHCGLLGHIENRCYKLHGYPPGHPKSKGRGHSSQANQVMVNDSDQTSSSLNLTPMQYQQLMQLLKSQSLSQLDASEAELPAGMVFTSCHTNLNLKKDSWLIDSGANSHIACSLHSFTESKPLDNHFVTLPNHTKIRALSIGTVQLSDSLFLYNVLYIPQFHVNLLSVSALLHSSPYSLQFSNSSFIIQDLLSKKVIGRGNQLGGLYVL